MKKVPINLLESLSKITHKILLSTTEQLIFVQNIENQLLVIKRASTLLKIEQIANISSVVKNEKWQNQFLSKIGKKDLGRLMLVPD